MIMKCGIHYIDIFFLCLIYFESIFEFLNHEIFSEMQFIIIEYGIANVCTTFNILKYYFELYALKVLEYKIFLYCINQVPKNS